MESTFDQILAEKITIQQELEAEIKDSEFQLAYTKYEINNLKDAIMTEYEKTIQEKLEEIEDLKESKN